MAYTGRMQATQPVMLTQALSWVWRTWLIWIIATLLFLCAKTAAHPPEAEFADWFRSLKEPGTVGMMGLGNSCCSPTKDCQMTDYETDAEGRYWIAVEGERVQVPPQKILQRTDNPTGHGVACWRYYDDHPVVRCFVRASEG
jgi:hypothetical protein